MSYNGSGVFVRLYNWVNDKNNGINILASRMDAEMNGFATGLTDCVTRDGQSPATANLPMGGFMHTNVAVATSRNQYAALSQVEDGVVNWQVAGGTVDALTISLSPSITALIDGQAMYVRAAGTNLTVSPSLTVNGLGPFTITKQGGSALAGNDWTINTELALRYNLANTRWEWTNSQASTSSVFSDTAFKVQDNGDATKQLQFEVSGVTTGTTRTLTVPNVSGTIITSADTATVTNTMAAVMAANTIKANATTGSASPTDLTISASNLVGRSAAGNIGGITLGTNLSLTGSVLNAATGSAGTVTSVATTAGLTGGPITGSGTLSINTNNSFGVEAYMMLFFNGTTLANGATTTQTNLQFVNFGSGGTTGGGGAPTGTYRNVSGAALSSANTVGLFIRVS